MPNGPEKALTGEFDIRILRRLWHLPELRNRATVPISVIHEVGEFALTNMGAMPEFSRLVLVDAVGADGATIKLQADTKEHTALAQRLDLQSMANLQVDVSLRRTATGLVRLNVDFSANVVQSCVVTLEPVAAKVADGFSLLCEGGKNRGQREDSDREVFVDPFGEDPIEPLDHGRIDVGELVAQHLSLSLDPYPRMPGIQTEAVLGDAGIVGGWTEIEMNVGSDEAPEGETSREDKVGADPDDVNPFAILEGWRSGGQGDGGAGNGAA